MAFEICFRMKIIKTPDRPDYLLIKKVNLINIPYSCKFYRALLIRKSTLCQKITVHNNNNKINFPQSGPALQVEKTQLMRIPPLKH